jgi:hypothetical protein
MHNSILVKRNHVAHTRTLITASALAEHLHIDPLKVQALTPKAKDKDVRLMMQREAVAELLSDIALSLGIDPGGSMPAEAPVPDAGDPVSPESVDDQNTGVDADQKVDGDSVSPDGDGADPQASSDELPPPVVDEE